MLIYVEGFLFAFQGSSTPKQEYYSQQHPQLLTWYKFYFDIQIIFIPHKGCLTKPPYATETHTYIRQI